MGQGIRVVQLLGLFFVFAASHVVFADTASEVKAVIESSNAAMKKNLKGDSSEISKLGTIEFWSSGGLMQKIKNDGTVGKFKAFSLTPKHIEVITLVEDKAAVAMYYSEGSMHPEGGSAVSHYLTRVTEVYIKEDKKWKIRASHYSAVTGGQGTSQTSID